MSETPLTDALDSALYDDAMKRKEPTEQYAELCRTLERENAALRERVEKAERNAQRYDWLRWPRRGVWWNKEVHGEATPRSGESKPET